MHTHAQTLLYTNATNLLFRLAFWCSLACRKLDTVDSYWLNTSEHALHFSKFSMLGAYLTEKTAYPLQRPKCQYCLGTVWGGCSCSQRVKAGFTLICLTALSEAASRLPWRILSGLSAQWSAGHWSLLVGTLHYLVRIGCRISVRYNLQKVLFAREHSGQICKLAGQWRMRFVPF
jgi:hypothetical protein